MAGKSDRIWSFRRCFVLVAWLSVAAVFVPVTALGSERCLQVVNVEFWDFLNIREQPSAEARIVGAIAPGHGEPLEQTGTCIPKTVRPTARWCPVIYYPTRTIRQKGYVKAYFTRPISCPPSLELYKSRVQ